MVLSRIKNNLSSQLVLGMLVFQGAVKDVMASPTGKTIQKQEKSHSKAIRGPSFFDFLVSRTPTYYADYMLKNKKSPDRDALIKAIANVPQKEREDVIFNLMEVISGNTFFKVEDVFILTQIIPIFAKMDSEKRQASVAFLNQISQLPLVLRDLVDADKGQGILGMIFKDMLEECLRASVDVLDPATVEDVIEPMTRILDSGIYINKIIVAHRIELTDAESFESDLKKIAPMLGNNKASVAGMIVHLTRINPKDRPRYIEQLRNVSKICSQHYDLLDFSYGLSKVESTRRDVYVESFKKEYERGISALQGEESLENAKRTVLHILLGVDSVDWRSTIDRRNSVISV